MNWTVLLTLITTLGPKLKAVWPHILAIIQALNEGAVGPFNATPESDKFVAACVANGVSEEEARKALTA
jgi:hypothetical protein